MLNNNLNETSCIEARRVQTPKDQDAEIYAYLCNELGLPPNSIKDYLCEVGLAKMGDSFHSNNPEPTPEDKKREGRIKQELKELDEIPDINYSEKKGTGKAYWERKEAKKRKPSSSNIKLWKVSRHHRRMARRLGRYL